MAERWVPYVVQHGEHLSEIAYRFGSTPDAVWSNDKNKDLAARRKNRDTLCTGDVLYVPNEKPAGLKFRAGRDNTFSATIPKVTVTLHVDSKQRSLANMPFEVRGAGGSEAIRGTVSDKGEISFQVPVTVRTADVWIPDARLKIPMHIGELDPIDEPSGAAQRLRNLGYLPASGAASADWLAYAIAAFQRQHGLKVDGVLSPETLQALLTAHRS